MFSDRILPNVLGSILNRKKDTSVLVRKIWFYHLKFDFANLFWNFVFYYIFSWISLIKCLFLFIYYPITGILCIFRYVLFLPYQEYFEIYSSYYFWIPLALTSLIPSGIVSFSSFELFLMCGIFEAVHMGKKMNNINSKMNIVCVRLC